MNHDLVSVVLIASGIAVLVFATAIPRLVLGRNYDLFS